MEKQLAEKIKNVLKLTKRAHSENQPKGVEFAWCHVDGSSLKWSDLVEVLEFLEDEFNANYAEATLIDEPIRSERSTDGISWAS